VLAGQVRRGHNARATLELRGPTWGDSMLANLHTFTLKFRGNTLAELEPRDARPGYPLYRGRSLESLRAPARLKEVTRFVIPEMDHEPQGTTVDRGEP